LPVPPNWDEGDVIDGVMIVKLVSWKYFHEYVTKEFLDFPSFVWRGQRSASWSLQSSFDRIVTTADPKSRNQLALQHLARFKMAARGRRGTAPAKIENESEWWALAQHNGMVTPLLDWTESPFVALYFAFEKESDKRGTTRAIWGLSNIKGKNREIKTAGEEHIKHLLETIRPMQDENIRLVNQAGLFTQLPPGITVDGWIGNNFAGEDKIIRLVKIEVPDDGREECLLTLNRMNINHLSLFPDLYGAGKHCNKALQIPKYAAKP
jgi:hypothetical protein